MVQGKKERLESIKPYQPGKPIEEVKREMGLKKVIKLASNENPFGPSQKVLNAIKKEALNINRYPDRDCFGLRNELSAKLGLPGGNITFGNGSDELIILTLRAFLNPGEEVVITEPTFLIYKIASLIEGAKVRIVPATKSLRYDMDAMLKAITAETRVVFIANPDNPMGSYVKKAELDKFLDGLPAGVVVFIDEAYYEFARGGDYPDTLKLIERKDINVIVARTFSKAYGLAGLRLGYALARKDIAEALNKVREPFNINSIAQAAGVAALRDSAYLKRSVQLVKRQKKRLYNFLRKLDVMPYESMTNFILLDTRRDSVKVFELLLRRGVIVREMSSWGFKGFIRVTIGLEEENDKFMKTFKEVLKEVPVS